MIDNWSDGGVWGREIIIAYGVSLWVFLERVILDVCIKNNKTKHVLTFLYKSQSVLKERIQLQSGLLIGDYF